MPNKLTTQHKYSPLAEKTIGFVNHHFWLLLSFTLLIALMLRVLALHQIKQTPYFDFLLWDERIYHEWAKQIAGGSYNPEAAYEFSPLPAYLMALIYWLFAPDVLYIRIVNICFGLMTCLLITLIGKEIGGGCIGLIAGLIAALYAPFILYSVVPLKTALSVMLCAVVIYLLTVEVQHPTPSKAFLMGALVGLAVNVRGNYNVFIIIGAAAVFWSTWKPERPNFSTKDFPHSSGGDKPRANNACCPVNVMREPGAAPHQSSTVGAGFIPPQQDARNGRDVFLANLVGIKKAFMHLLCFVLGLCLVMAPVAIRNYRITGEFIISTTQSGFNFYIGNNLTNQDPYYRPLPFASNSPFKQGPQFTIEASRRVGKALSASEASSYWYKEAFNEALNNPFAYLVRLTRKVLALFNRFEAADHYDIDFLSQFIALFQFPLPGYTLIWPLGMAGLALGLKFRTYTGWLLAAFTAYALTLILFYSGARYRVPLLAILIPFVPWGVARFIESLKRRDRAKMVRYFVALIIFTVLEFLPLDAAKDRTAYYNTHAVVLYSTGREQEAIRYWEISSEMDRFFSPSANLSLAQAYYRKGDLQKAETYLQKIDDSSYQSAAKYHLLGDIFQLKGSIREAVTSYERSLAINSGEITVYRKLVSLLNNTNPSAALFQYKKMQEISTFYRGL